MVYSKVLFTTTMLLSVCLFLSAPNAVGQETTTKGSNLLVDADWVEQHLDEIRIISLESKPSEFIAGHIPNSIYVNWKTDIIAAANTDRYSLPSQSEVEALMSRIGVTPETTIVLADNLSNRVSTRLYWTLKTYGHPDVRILDGGVTSWRNAGKRLSKDMISITPTQYKALKTRQETANDFADTETVRKAVDNGDAIIDGRPVKQFSGEVPGAVFHTDKAHKRRGHIKSAISVPWKDNYNADGTFKSVEELRKIYAAANVLKDQEAVTYCNEGLHAATTWFVLKELLGYPKVRLYDDSMADWANRFDTPMEMPKVKTDR